MFKSYSIIVVIRHQECLLESKNSASKNQWAGNKKEVIYL